MFWEDEDGDGPFSMDDDDGTLRIGDDDVEAVCNVVLLIVEISDGLISCCWLGEIKWLFITGLIVDAAIVVVVVGFGSITIWIFDDGLSWNTFSFI